MLCAAATAALQLDVLAGGRPPIPLDSPHWEPLLPGLLFVLAGGVLATRLPRRPLAWLMLASGTITVVAGAGSAYASLSISERGGELPGTAVALYAGARLGPVIGLLVPMALLFFPDGRLPSSRWRWPAAVAVAGQALGAAWLLTVPWRVLAGDEPIAPELRDVQLDPMTPPLPDGFWPPTPALFWSAFLASSGLAVAVCAARCRLSDLGRRARWRRTLPGAAIIAPRWPYDVRRLLGRILLYTSLATVVVVVDVAVFAAAATLVAEPLAAVAGAGVVAVLYTPLRLRLERWVNRMLGRRDEPHDVVSVLARSLDASVGPDEPLLEAARMVAATFRSPYVRVEVNRADGSPAVAEHGERREDVVVVPFKGRGTAGGRLVLVPWPGLRPSDEDQRLVAAVVRQAAAAVGEAAVAGALRRGRERLVMEVAEERRRIRRDLHDGLGPALAAAALKIETARRLAPRTGEPAAMSDTASAPDLADAAGTVDAPDLADTAERAEAAGAADAALCSARGDLVAVLADVRRLVSGLRPPPLDQFGLAGAVEQLAARFHGRSLRVGLRCAGDLSALPAAAEEAAYRIVGEALANVSRHAGASGCAVRIAAGDGALEVEVTDDGSGVRPGAPAGVGLLGMRERAEELGGTCAVSARPEGGTRVHAVLPYGPRPDAPAPLASAGSPS